MQTDLAWFKFLPRVIFQHIFVNLSLKNTILKEEFAREMVTLSGHILPARWAQLPHAHFPKFPCTNTEGSEDLCKSCRQKIQRYLRCAYRIPQKFNFPCTFTDNLYCSAPLNQLLLWLCFPTRLFPKRNHLNQFSQSYPLMDSSPHTDVKPHLYHREQRGAHYSPVPHCAHY